MFMHGCLAFQISVSKATLARGLQQRVDGGESRSLAILCITAGGRPSLLLAVPSSYVAHPYP